MVPPDGARTNRLPTMSWESVVDTPGSDATPDESAAAPAPSTPPPAASAPLTAPTPIDAPVQPNAAVSPQPTSDGDGQFEPIAFAPLTLSLGDPDVAGPPPTPAPVPPAPAPPSVAPPVAEAAVVAAAPVEPVVVKHTAPAPVVPAVDESHVVADATPSSDPAETAPAVAAATAPTATPAAAPPAVDVPSTELPTIVEATPVPEAASALDGLATTDEAPPAPTGPRLPSSQQPSQRHVAPAQVVAEVPPTPTATRRKRKGRRGLKLVLTVAVLGGLIAAGIVFGREYLLPGEWDATTEPYAVAVEEATGAEFAEPIAVIAEPPADYNARMAAELTGDWIDDESMWRSLGLISGSVTVATVAEVFDPWQAAIYSTDDGQVYRDQGATGPQLDALITQQMVAAQLDQQFGWSAEQGARTLDDAAQTLAQVQREARSAQRSSVYATELEPLAPALSIFAPPILGYRALAPAVFAEFENPATAPVLEGIGTGGPGPLPTVSPITAPSPSLIAGDIVEVSAQAMDPSFWYLVFAGYLDTRTAFEASESIVDNSVVVATRGPGRCAYSTFAGSDVAQTATLRSALEAWVASAPAELAASFSVLPDGTLQLVSCDPGAGFDNGTRLGIARELVGWRMAELATIEAITAADGTQADVDAAWAAVAASSVGSELASLPPETSPAAAAAAARASVGAVLTPGG